MGRIRTIFFKTPYCQSCKKKGTKKVWYGVDQETRFSSPNIKSQERSIKLFNSLFSPKKKLKIGFELIRYEVCKNCGHYASYEFGIIKRRGGLFSVVSNEK